MVRGLLHLPAPQGTRLLARDLTDTVRSTAEQLVRSPGPDALHDLRVAIRRLRTLLRVYRPYLGEAAAPRIRRGLGHIASRTGTTRDIDVQLAWIDQHATALAPHEQIGVQWLRRRLEQQHSTTLAYLRHKEAKQLRRLIDFIGEQVRDYCLPADPTDAAHQPAATLAAVTSDFLGTLLHDFEPQLDAIRSIEDRNAAHAARITGKQIRYLIEPLRKELSAGAEAVTQLKQLQDLLGEFNDANQFEAVVAQAREHANARQERRFSKALLEGKVLDETWLKRTRERDPCPGLAALHACLEARQEESFAQVEQWLHDEAFTLRRRLHDMVIALCRSQTPDREIERKYLLRSLPDLVVGSAAQLIEQGYLPGSQVRERIRRLRVSGTERYYRTIKVGDGIDRAEFEEETTREIFASMWPLTEGKRVRKRRYRVVFGELTWEIDEFLDHPLILAEVEIPHPSIDPDPPEWLRPYVVRQVSGEPEFLNVNLAR